MIHPLTREEAKTLRYGRGDGLHRATPYDPNRCAYDVGEPPHYLDSHQCKRRPTTGPDGLYCKQHAARLAEQTALRERFSVAAAKPVESAAAPADPVTQLRADLERALRPWTVKLIAGDDYLELSCEVVDVGHSDRVLVVRSPEVDELLRRASERQALPDSLKPAPTGAWR